MYKKPTYEELERRVEMLEESLRERDADLDLLPDQVVVQDLEHRIAQPRALCAAGKNGEISSAEIEARNMQTKDGIERAVAVGDSERRKQAEDALQKSEEKHRSILKTAMDGFVMTDVHGTILEVNAAYCRMSGYSKDELLDMKIEDLAIDESADEIARRLRDIANRGHDRFESTHRRKDGGVVDVEISAMFRKGEEACFVCFVRDISEKKKQEQELKLRSLVLDQIHDHVTITDLNGVISYVNQATEKSLCRNRQALVGEKTDIYGEDAERGATQNEILVRTLRNGFWRGEVVNFAADGGELIMDCRWGDENCPKCTQNIPPGNVPLKKIFKKNF